jgi:hypothetical protein
MSRPLTLPALARAALGASWLALAATAQAQPALDAAGSPGRAYLDLRGIVAKAATPEAVLPYLSSNYRRVVSNLPKVERDGWLARLKRTPPGSPQLQAQALAGDRCALGVVARDATHVKWSGRVEMVREGGAWKLADEAWTTEIQR